MKNNKNNSAQSSKTVTMVKELLNLFWYERLINNITHTISIVVIMVFLVLIIYVVYKNDGKIDGFDTLIEIVGAVSPLGSGGALLYSTGRIMNIINRCLNMVENIETKKSTEKTNLENE